MYHQNPSQNISLVFSHIISSLLFFSEFYKQHPKHKINNIKQHKITQNITYIVQYYIRQIRKMHMSAQVVQDSVNKYRHGVLIGNFAEEEFGKDSVNRGRETPVTGVSTMKATHGLANSLHRFHPVITPEDKRTQTLYKFSDNFDSKAKEPEKETTYDIFYRQEYPRRVPIVQNDPKKEERLNKEKELFGYTKTQLENTSLRKTTGKFHYRKDYNDPVLEGDKDAAGSRAYQRASGSGLGAAGDLQEDGDALHNVIHGSGEGDDETPLGVGNNKIGQIRAKSLNPCRLNELVDKAQASKLPKKQTRQNQSNLKLGGDQDEGQESHILFGHGLTVDKFHTRQFATTYDLSYNQKVKPQTQINSFFKPDLTQTAKQFHRETFFQKNHQSKIPQFNNKNQLLNDKLQRPYAPYTKTFDQKHMKTPYLRK